MFYFLFYRDILIFVGGVIPPQDYDLLYKSGTAAIFGPGIFKFNSLKNYKILFVCFLHFHNTLYYITFIYLLGTKIPECALKVVELISKSTQEKEKRRVK